MRCVAAAPRAPIHGSFCDEREKKAVRYMVMVVVVIVMVVAVMVAVAVVCE